MLECIFQELKHDGDDGSEPPVPEDECLAPVASKVSHDEDIHLVLDIVPGINIVSIVDLAVTTVVLLRYGLPQVSIYVPDSSSR